MIIIVALPGMGKTEVATCVGHLLQKEHWPVVYVKEKKLMDICQEILYQVDPSALDIKQRCDFTLRAKAIGARRRHDSHS